MEPRFGRLYASAVLRPLAEQVVGALDAKPGETACDLMCDGAMLGVALGAAVGAHGSVVLVDTEAALLDTARPDIARTGCGVSTLVATAGAVPLAESSCDRVGSLCTLGFWDGGSMFAAAERLVRPSGRAAVVTWDVARPPPHEVALVDALRDVAGINSAFLTRCLAVPDPAQVAAWETTTLQDVVRFDGIGTYWAAMVTERPVSAELSHLSGDALSAIRAACQRALEPCTAADGTLCIPVRVALWRLRGGVRG